jgi:polyhydroxyalkanoate synthase
MTQASTLFTSRAVLPSWKNGSLAWKPHLAPRADRLRQDLIAADAEKFDQAIDLEMRRRMDGFLRGIEAYRHHPYHRDLPPMPTVWQEGTTKLIDYSLPGASGVPVLVIPSLINRAYILDLSAKRSLMRYLAGRGLRPFLVDWDAPGIAERHFSLEDYIAGRLGRALDVVLKRAGPPALVGYCMGGVLGLGLGVLRQDDVRGLVALATPWDFHQPDTTQSRLIGALRAMVEDALEMHGELPVDLLQALFSSIDPSGCERKFRAFARLKTSTAKARDFVALEDWLNDGVALSAPVARQALFDWYVDDVTARNRWKLGERLIRPQDFTKPSLAMIPAKDRIVPPASALALAEALPRVRTRVIAAGHIGMITGSRAKTDVYGPLAKWLAHGTGG